MASYTRLKKQLEILQAEVESARKAELLPIIKRLQREMAAHGISAADLVVDAHLDRSVAKQVAGKRPVKGAGAPKFRDPKSGLTWSGFGRAPKWIAGARDRTKFLINGTDEAQAAPSSPLQTTTKGRKTSKASTEKLSAGASKKVAKAAKKTALKRVRGKNVTKPSASSSRKATPHQAQMPDTAQPTA